MSTNTATEQTNVRLPVHLKLWLKKCATKAHRSMSQELIVILERAKSAQTRRQPEMEVVKHLHQKPGRMKRTGALQPVETTGPTFPAVKAPVVSRPFLAREDEYLRKHYCIDQGPSECANVLRRGFQTVVRRAAELEIDHLRAPWKALQASRAAMARVAAERLGAVKKEDAVQPYRPDYMSSGPSWAGFESHRSSRPGAEDYREHPSRYSDVRVFMDGRMEKVA